jgi:hypothetical protein
MSAPAAPRPPRLLNRLVSPAQREAARRHGLYSRLHLFSAEETQAFRAELRDLFESMNPRGPLAAALVSEVAFASFQLRRAFGLEVDFLARNPPDIDTIVRMVAAIDTFDSRYSRRFYRAIALLEYLDQRAAEKKESGKRTPELIENKENAPARQVTPARLQSRAPDAASDPPLESRTEKSYYSVWILRSEDPASTGRGRVSC